MKLSYEVFHLENAGIERDTYTKEIHKAVSKDFDHLNSGTINFMQGQEKYINFLINNKEFRSTGDVKIGEAGVWASNYNAWKTLLDSDYDCVMLFEDDCLIDSDGATHIYQYMKELPENWDFFSPFVHKNQYHIYNDSHDIGSNNVCKAYQDWSLACYIVSRDGAKKALEYIKSEGFNEPVDYFVFNKSIKRFNSYTLKPYARKYVELSDVPTTIQNIEKRINLNGSI